ncbi:restriction endonuclease subunit S [Actinoplanes sp. LDG1-06]|uniref:Restriction endonuclease subunit S n=1 Tax=Paractinoplanes ovalisporus TaxID=2810368 RepID=A0ABS2AMH7_9ACTN|nr:restriction endonuclease subunit S [Actinoplanes ovalisporus]MBM2621058.1 restriction endonuclease subunit S [Actinoplanes ovalisporus]
MSQVAPWLVDSRWPTVPIRYLAKLGTGHTPSRQHPEYWQDCDIPWMTLADVWQLRDGTVDYVQQTNDMISKVGLANSAAVLHPEGTVILSRTASVGFSGIMGRDMATSQDFATWTCGPRLHPKYLLYVLRAMAPDLRRIAAGSTHKTIYMPDIEELRSPVPRMEEQRRIADFLEAETCRLTHLTEMRRAQVSLLRQREFAAISETLTGAATAGSRRSTGWRWLPDVPSDWLIGPVHAYFDVMLGKMLNPERASGRHPRPYLRNANVHWYRIGTDDLAEMSFEPSERGRFRIEPGDLLVCEGGAGVAESAVWDGRVAECYYQKSLHRVRARQNVPVEWLMYWLRLAKEVGLFASEGNVATIPHLTGEQLRACRIPIPPDGLRRVAELGLEIAEINRLVGAINSAETLMAERRQALITAAVTGQIDVTTARGVD